MDRFTPPPPPSKLRLKQNTIFASKQIKETRTWCEVSLLSHHFGLNWGKNCCSSRREEPFSRPRFFRYRKNWYVEYSICIYATIWFFLKKFSVLRVLGLKKASKFDLFQKCQNQNLHFWIFSKKFLQKWTPHTLFTLFWYPILHMWNFHFASFWL